MPLTLTPAGAVSIAKKGQYEVGLVCEEPGFSMLLGSVQVTERKPIAPPTIPATTHVDPYAKKKQKCVTTGGTWVKPENICQCPPKKVLKNDRCVPKKVTTPPPPEPVPVVKKPDKPKIKKCSSIDTLTAQAQALKKGINTEGKTCYKKPDGSFVWK